MASRPRRPVTPAPQPLRRPPPPHGPFVITSEALVAGAALILSLTTVLTGAWFALRGSVVTAVPPDSVFLYVDKGKAAVLTAGFDTALVNSASGNYGDVVTRITLEIDGPDGRRPAFDYETLVSPVLSENAEAQAKDCPVTARCVVAGRQFLAIEEPRRTLDVPGGSSRSEYIGFVLHKSNCARDGACDAFVDVPSAASALSQAEALIFRVHYRLYSDGEKVAVCRVNLKFPGQTAYEPWLEQRLTTTGWVVLACERDPVA